MTFSDDSGETRATTAWREGTVDYTSVASEAAAQHAGCARWRRRPLPRNQNERRRLRNHRQRCRTAAFRQSEGPRCQRGGQAWPSELVMLRKWLRSRLPEGRQVCRRQCQIDGRASRQEVLTLRRWLHLRQLLLAPLGCLRLCREDGRAVVEARNDA